MRIGRAPTPSLLSAWQDSVASSLLTEIRGSHRLVPDQTRVIESYRDLLQKVLQAFDMQAGCIVFFAEDLQEFDSFVSHGYPESDSLRTWTVNPEDGIVARVARSREIDLNNNVLKSPYYKSLHPGTKAQLTIPLVESEKSFAVLALESEKKIPRSHEKAARKEFEQFAVRVAQLRRAVYHAHLERAFDWLNRIAEAEDEEHCWQLVTHGVLSFIDSRSEVAILRRDGGQLVHVAHVNVPKPPEDLRIGIAEGRGYTCYVGRTRRPFYCPNVRDRERFPDYREVVEATSSQYTVPLMFRADLVGVLNVGSRAIFGFPQSIRQLLDLFASHAANTLHYAIVVKQLRTVSHKVKNRLKLFTWIAPEVEKALPDEKQADKFRNLVDAVEYAKTLIEGIVYYPLQPLQSKLVDITASLRRILDEFQPIFDAREIEVRHDLDQEAPALLEVVKEDFEEVVRNVLWNAIEAMAESTQKTLGVSLARPEQTAETSPKHQIRVAHFIISITDSGPGVRQDLMEDRGRRGLGLWICDRALANYGGYISLEAAEPTGTAARLYLPRSTT